MAEHYDYKALCGHAKDHAVAHLKENPSEVNEHIENLRNVVKSKPHLTCPTDSHTLLKFLRVVKFDLKHAEAKLDNFCTFKSSTRGAPEYFHRLCLDDKCFKEFIEKALVVPLGKSEDGHIIILMRPSEWDSEAIPIEKAVNLIFMGLDMLIEDEETQIYGLKIIYDMKDAPRHNMATVCDAKLLKNINRIFHDSYPIRLEGEIFYNEPELFDAVFKMYSFFKSDEEKKILARVKGDLKDLAEHIPGIEKIMPTEYGGHGGPICEIAKAFNEKFKAYYTDEKHKHCVCVDESKRPEETLCYLREHGEYTGPTLEKE